MPDLKITIGGRDYDVACQPGEESFLLAAASLLDVEAATLNEQIGRVPEQRMLLMSGLMLADKTAGFEEQLRQSEERVAALEDEVEALRRRQPPRAERVEVPVLPSGVIDMMAELAARAEALADAVDDAARQ
jgi:cell division protein ZapA